MCYSVQHGTLLYIGMIRYLCQSYGIGIVPGSTIFTRMPLPPTSLARDFVNPTNPACRFGVHLRASAEA